jgi:hypothetical protein
MLKNLWARLIATFEQEPAAALFAVNAGLSPLFALILHWPHTQVAAAATISAALAALVTAFKARPVAVPAMLGAAATIATAAAAFGLNLSPAEIAAGSSALNLLLAFLFRANLVPVANLRRSAGK